MRAAARPTRKPFPLLHKVTFAVGEAEMQTLRKFRPCRLPARSPTTRIYLLALLGCISVTVALEYKVARVRFPRIQPKITVAPSETVARNNSAVRETITRNGSIDETGSDLNNLMIPRA